MTARKRLKHVRLSTYQLHVRMDRVDRGVFELVVSDQIAPLKHELLFADSNRDAIRQFSSYLDNNFPQQDKGQS